MNTNENTVFRGHSINTFNGIAQITEDIKITSTAIMANSDCSGMMVHDINDTPSLSNGQYWLRISNTKFYLRLYSKPNIITRFLLKKLLGLVFYEAHS